MRTHIGTLSHGKINMTAMTVPTMNFLLVEMRLYSLEQLKVISPKTYSYQKDAELITRETNTATKLCQGGVYY
jgi:hypothetical protein